MKTILVTGAAGFIGSHVVDRLLADGFRVVGIDNFNDYYDPAIKEENIQHALYHKNFKLYRMDIADLKMLGDVFAKEKPEKVVHLAARAGVRASIASPLLYCQVNVLGTVNLLTAADKVGVSQFIFGSSSSVYGNCRSLPFSEDDKCENIISPYGASKRSAEFFVEVVSLQTKMQCVILRFFTVYGPRGRPDMAPALFTKAIERGQTLTQFGDGSSSRDYTYIDDIVDGIVKSMGCDLKFAIINLGNSQPVCLSDFIKTCEKVIGKRARIKKTGRMVGDAQRTWADITVAKKLLSWEPKTSLSDGLVSYIKWQRREN